MQSRVQMGSSAITRVKDSARVMRVARLPRELELRQSASQPSTKDVEGLNPAPHIHEQMTTSNYVKLWLRHCVQLYAQQHHA